MGLFKNYLKVSWRDLTRNKTFAVVNLVGLVAGFTACLLILQYVFYESSFDKFHEEADLIYRVANDRYQNGDLVQHGTITYPAVGPALQRDFPEVTGYTRMTTGGRTYMRRGDELIMVTSFLYADEFFLDMFNFPMKHGDAATALKEPFSIVLTESAASRFLKPGEEITDLIGETLQIFTSAPLCKVSGILEDVPANSHLEFDLLISYESMVSMSGGAADQSWTWSDFYHYIKLQPGSDPAMLEAKFDEFSVKYFKNGEVSGGVEKFALQPLTDAHLYSDYEYELGNTSNGKIVWLMLIIAIFIVVIAWVNFINLSTSRATERAREIGVRKSLGAVKGHLFWQFLAESVLVNGIALLAAIALTGLLQEPFMLLTGLPLSITSLLTTKVIGIPFVLLFVPAFVLCLVLISIYPSKVLAGFKTTEVVKGRAGLESDSISLRKTLVVFQFVAAMLLVTGTLTIYRQIAFMQDQDLGMNMENNLVLYGPAMASFDSAFIENFGQFKRELTATPGISSVTASSRVFGQQTGRWFQIRNVAKPEVKNLSANYINVDPDFITQFDIDLVAGRNLKPTDYHRQGSLVNKLIINQKAVDHFKFDSPESAVGQKINVLNRDFEIVGVVENYHQRSLHQPLEPIIFVPFYSTDHYFTVKIEDAFKKQAIATVGNVFEKYYPGNYLDYFFMEDFYEDQYQDDQTVKSIAQLFTFLAILIAFLGLYALVMITINKKMKEIAVRKVLGAKITDLIMMLGKDFFLLVFIAILIGVPISYFTLNSWLENYAYNNGVEILVLILAAVGLIGISVLTVLIQIRKISNSNPVDSLKYE
ncbi:MAG: ABC transporter permease [Bacteroidota bacterium]